MGNIKTLDGKKLTIEPNKIYWFKYCESEWQQIEGGSIVELELDIE
ncbi:hypothetical protein LCGC14_0677160 [marine sediment metagenome]|uniref:Uncharacterized protein n=1 Tax=marine sediment metagenome TaxID=412755 RepID=A0A0F9R9G5_9ZZZZ